MGLTNYPNGINDAGFAVTYGVAEVVNGAGTATPPAPDPSGDDTATLTGFVATLNEALGGTAVAAPCTIGGTITASTLVLGIQGVTGGTVAGTATVAYAALWTVA